MDRSGSRQPRRARDDPRAREISGDDGDSGADGRKSAVEDVSVERAFILMDAIEQGSFDLVGYRLTGAQDERVIRPAGLFARSSKEGPWRSLKNANPVRKTGTPSIVMFNQSRAVKNSGADCR